VTAPLSFKEFNRVAKAWDALASDLYIVWTKTPNGGRFVFTEDDSFDPAAEDYDVVITEAFAELLHERTGTERLDPEVMVRIFLTEEEAGFYMETVGAFLGLEPDQIEVQKLKLSDLFDVRDTLLEIVQTHSVHRGVQFVVSRLRVEQFVPDSTDVVWSSQATQH
jgi:hypothetical protein